jgi:hypothetical protein
MSISLKSLGQSKRWLKPLGVLAISLLVWTYQSEAKRNKKSPSAAVPAESVEREGKAEKSEKAENVAPTESFEKAVPSGTATRKATVVPGGGLDAHERAGGHLLKRHVGKTEADLIARLNQDRGIGSASSFANKAMAEAVCAAIIKARQKQIERFMKSGEDRLVLEFNSTQPVGISVSRRSMKAVEVTGARLIIDKDRNFAPTGWRIITGYPQS